MYDASAKSAQGLGRNYAEPAYQCDAAPQTELDVVRGRLNEVLNYVCTQGERVELITAKLTGGGSLEGSTVGKPQPMPSGTLAQMNEALDAILARLQRTDGVVSRLQGAI